jgi:serine/threonine protein kinase
VADQASGEGWSLPGYQLGQVLGRGGFAIVYRARQLSLGRDVAVKVLTTDLASEGDRRRFERERQALARLSPHPGVVDVIDAGVTAERRPFVVMRLYPGGTLADRLAREGRLSVTEVIAFVARLADALDAAHAIGVIHRDVKPQNVLLTETGEPVLADFGIAGMLEGPDDGSSTSTSFFTITHVAPEILDQRRYSVASDVYALASTTYQLLVGVPAFNPTDPRIATLILDTPPPPITVPGVPEHVARTVLAALAKDPAARPPSAGAFAAALAAGRAFHVEQAPTEPAPAPLPATRPALPSLPATLPAPAPSPFPASVHDNVTQVSVDPFATAPLASESGLATVIGPGPVREAGPSDAVGKGAGGRPSGRLPGRRAVLSAMALGVVAAATGSTLYVRSRTQQPQVAILDGHTDDVLSVSWSPDGKSLASSGADLTVRLWDVGARRQLGDPLNGHTGWVWSVAWSPDGQTLATAGGDGDLTARIWDVPTRQQSGKPLTGHAAGLWSVAWSPSGTQLVTASSDRTARIWDAAAHSQLGAPLTGHTDGVWSAAWSPDGRTMATTGGGRDQTVRLWDASTHTQLGAPLTGHSSGVRAVAWSSDGKVLASAGADATIRLWDPTTYQQVGAALTGHGNWVDAVAWHPHRNLLASAGGDHTVRLWDVGAHRQLAVLTGHSSGVRTVAWSPDGTTLASAGSDHRVRVWSQAW